MDAFFGLAKHRRVIQTNRERWDYKHQVLATRHLRPWQVLAWVKLTEVILQTRPRALWRTFLQPDADLRHAMRWYSRMGGRAWPVRDHESSSSATRARRPDRRSR